MQLQHNIRVSDQITNTKDSVCDNTQFSNDTNSSKFLKLSRKKNRGAKVFRYFENGLNQPQIVTLEI